MPKVSESVGQKIRSLRKQKGLTLRETAELSKRSSSLLSLIERGIVNPSLSTLISIAEVMQIPISQLVMEDSDPEEFSSSLMKPNERKILTTEGRVQFQLLSRNLNVHFEFILNEWPPGSSTGKQPYTHGGEECGLLLEGELEVEVNGKLYHMKPGDTITLNSSVPHRITNSGKERALAVWVNSVPWLFSLR
jgi:transcriptional regulator with XRE-family HTH domain